MYPISWSIFPMLSFIFSFNHSIEFYFSYYAFNLQDSFFYKISVTNFILQSGILFFFSWLFKDISCSFLTYSPAFFSVFTEVSYFKICLLWSLSFI